MSVLEASLENSDGGACGSPNSQRRVAQKTNGSPEVVPKFTQSPELVPKIGPKPKSVTGPPVVGKRPARRNAESPPSPRLPPKPGR